jgi:signal transduction histidine kinase
VSAWVKSYPWLSPTQLVAPLIALIAAAGATLLLGAVVVNVPLHDLELLGLFVLLSGLASFVLGYGGLALAARWRGGLGITFAVGHMLGVIVVLINVVVTAILMFLSQHDLGVLGLLLFFAAALSIFFGATQGQMLADSIAVLTRAARRMAEGNLGTRVVVTRVDEIGELAEAFNRMAVQLEEYTTRQRDAEQARRDLIAAVSHDLRTPLSSIRAMVEALCDHVVADPETVDRYHQTIRSETERLNALIGDLFELSRIEAGAVELHPEPASLYDLISDTLRSMGPRAEAKKVVLDGDVPPNLPMVRIDLGRIQRVLVNLVENAIRHTPENGRITLTAVDVGREVRVDVTDTGEGIAEADLPAVFDRFYRGEKSRSRDAGGAGLGLAIARGLVEAQGGRIWVQSTKGQGSVFSFTLPKVELA